MASFNWLPQVSSGCPFCGTSVNERGFVDCIADTVVRNTEGEISGVVDIYICATCIEQIARLVGSATQHETLEMAQMVIDRDEELEKTRDEVKSWTQRFNNLINALSEGIDVSSIDRAYPGDPVAVGGIADERKVSEAGSKKSRQGEKQLADSAK